MIGQVFAILRHEWSGMFATPLAAVFLAAFAAAAGFFTFQIAGFLEAGLADLSIFFEAMPWLMAVFMPAIGMRAWSEEWRSGASEIVLSWPAPVWVLVCGKFLAHWLVAGAALVLTMPIWITASLLGAPDNGAILVGYGGAWLMAGGFLSLSHAASALTRTQAIAFVAAVLTSLAFTALGVAGVSDWVRSLLGSGVAAGLAQLSVLERFQPWSRGVIDGAAVIYFFSLMGMGLVWASVAIEARRGSGPGVGR